MNSELEYQQFNQRIGLFLKFVTNIKLFAPNVSISLYILLSLVVTVGNDEWGVLTKLKLIKSCLLSKTTNDRLVAD